MTTQELSQRFDAALGKLGQPVEVEDPSNRDQCMDWVFYVLDVYGIPRETIRHLFAYEAFTRPNALTSQYFDLIPNSPSLVPIKGDIGVFGKGIGPAGHIVACTGNGNTKRFESTDQNWYAHSYVERVWHSYDYFMGVLRPKVTAATPGGSMTNDIISKDNIGPGRIIYSENLGRDFQSVHTGALDAEILQYHNGKHVVDLLWETWNGPEGQTWRSIRGNTFAQAADAERYKQGVIKSSAWVVDMQQNPDYVQTVIDSLHQFKADTLANPTPAVDISTVPLDALVKEIVKRGTK